MVMVPAPAHGPWDQRHGESKKTDSVCPCNAACTGVLRLLAVFIMIQRTPSPVALAHQLQAPGCVALVGCRGLGPCRYQWLKSKIEPWCVCVASQGFAVL
jgi:hypothetical protein